MRVTRGLQRLRLAGIESVPSDWTVFQLFESLNSNTSFPELAHVYLSDSPLLRKDADVSWTVLNAAPKAVTVNQLVNVFKAIRLRYECVNENENIEEHLVEGRDPKKLWDPVKETWIERKPAQTVALLSSYASTLKLPSKKTPSQNVIHFLLLLSHSRDMSDFLPAHQCNDRFLRLNSGFHSEVWHKLNEDQVKVKTDTSLFESLFLDVCMYVIYFLVIWSEYRVFCLIQISRCEFVLQ
eukprot:Lithocolla_globosa_v1_NODE_2523_length_1965_cov_5.573822.p2 type:complete len:239 gc:universal NODE_2523_length_1965_cov_5.573822:86-802(+)